jgi:hypothetical protein
MVLTGSAQRALQTRHARKLPDGFEFFRSDWMEAGKDPVLSPTVFLVEQPAGSVLAPHFHTQNQFQVIVAGSGRIGAHEVAVGSVHYAGAFTGYGPVVAGPQGLHYFTIRPVYEVGAHFIATSRERMVRGPKRHMQGAPVAQALPEQLRALEEAGWHHTIAPQPDGLAASVCNLPPGACVEAPAPAACGQFQLVMAGAMRHEEGWLAGWESRYHANDAPTAMLEAGPQGLQVLVLQVPAKASDYLSRETAL